MIDIPFFPHDIALLGDDLASRKQLTVLRRKHVRPASLIEL